MTRWSILNVNLGSMRMCVYDFVRACVCPSGFVLNISSTDIFMSGFQNDLTQLFFLLSKSAISNFHSGRSKVKDTQTRLVVPLQLPSYVMNPL